MRRDLLAPARALPRASAACRQSLDAQAHRSGLRLGAGLAAALCVALATLADPAQAQGQWKWRDAQGRVTVSDLPPPREVADKDILQRPAAVARAPAPAVPGVAPATAGGGVAAPGVAASAPAAARPAPVDKELEARKRAAEAEKAAKAKAEEQRNAAVRAENCKRARQHLATMDSGQRVARINEKGEREVLDDETRAAESRRARDIIASECR